MDALRKTRGFSLIELLVSMAIALVVTLAITTVMVQGEGAKRSTTSVNEINQTGAYVAYLLDRQIRSAGSGFSQRWGEAFGCSINATKSGTVLLPRTAAIDPPFANAPLTLSLAPVIIQADGANVTSPTAETRGDLITVLSGTAGFSESPSLVNTSSVTSSGLTLPNAIGFSPNDLILLTDSGVPAGCMVEQVGTAAVTGALTLAGPYYTQTGSGVALTNFGASTYAIQLGNTANLPQFQIFGVGDNRTLFSFDFLGPDTPMPIADSVVEMRALYGLDTTNPPDGTLDTWVLPDASGYDAATLSDGSTASRAKLRQIVAIRLGLVLRTALKEKPKTLDPVHGYDAPATLTLFGDLDASVRRTHTIAAADQNYRHRTIEVTVPLRNVLLAPQSP